MMLSMESIIALVTLTSLEVVLGIDNIIFISILVSKLPKEKHKSARLIGLTLAMGMRILLLFSISWVMGLTKPLFEIVHHQVSGRDLILLLGGLFLLAKSTHEIHEKLEGEIHDSHQLKRASFRSVLIQIMLLDIVFSLDSVITAVGMSNQISIMVASVVIAVGFMMIFAGSVSDFVERHPTVKMLALSFLLLIGFTLLSDGLGHHIPKGYIYFAMAFSVFVEMLNLRIRHRSEKPVQLRQPPL
jgi:predicted tellurium resistance membrane protein TerC